MKKAFIFIALACLVMSFVACSDGEGVESSEVGAASSKVVNESSETSVAVSESESSTADEESVESAVDESSEDMIDESSEAEGFDVSAIVGTWKRVATEVEGDVNDGGDCTLTVTGTGLGDLKVSYSDKEFPENAFSDKAATVTEVDTEIGWRVIIDHVGKFETTYDFEITEDGKLWLANNFEIDGAPMVAYEIFEKAE
jgi:hypothetical protein